MFVLCPHCQFLVALDPVTGEPPPRCPRCDGAVQPAVAPPHSAAVPEDAPAALPKPDRHALPPSTPAPPSGSAALLDDDIADAEGAGVERADVEDPDVERAQTSDENAVAPIASADAVREAAIVEPAPDGPPVSTRPRKLAPSFVRGESARSPASRAPRRWWPPASLTGLIALLSLQIVLADRAQLAADARWRPALLQVCAVLHCDLPAWRELDAITLLDRDVRPDLRRPGVLHATASFRNDARWPQPWPKLLLTLSDADGRVTGARSFTPSEYLRAADAATTQNGLASGQSASVALDIIEPEPRTVAFTFDFR
jgi:hypothetical protein